MVHCLLSTTIDDNTISVSVYQYQSINMEPPIAHYQSVDIYTLVPTYIITRSANSKHIHIAHIPR